MALLRSRRARWWLAAGLGLTSTVAAACGGPSAQEPATVDVQPSGQATAAPGLAVDTYPSLEGEVTLAHSPGLLFGTFLVMEEAGVLEAMAPNMQIEWRTINETSQQRDALLAGELDFTSCSSWPFIQGWASGVPWKIVGITNVWDGELFVKPGTVDSVEDFMGTQMKMSPGPGTAQELVTQAYLDQQGFEPDALANNWTLVEHADAIHAVQSGQLEGEFATGEYIVEARRGGLEPIYKLSDANGGEPFASACAAVSETYLDENPAFAKIYARALQAVSEWIATHHEQAAKIMAKSTDGQADPELFEAGLNDTQVTNFRRHDGLLKKTATVLKQLGLTDTVPSSPEDVYAFPESAGRNW